MIVTINGQKFYVEQDSGPQIRVKIDPTMPDTEVRMRDETTGYEVKLCNVKAEHSEECTATYAHKMADMHEELTKVAGRFGGRIESCCIAIDGEQDRFRIGERDYYTKAEVEKKFEELTSRICRRFEMNENRISNVSPPNPKKPSRRKR